MLIFAASSCEESLPSLKIADLSKVASWHFDCSLDFFMDEKKTWWQMMPMGKKGWIGAGVTVFALVVLLAWMVVRTPSDRSSFALQDQEDKIRDMEDRIAKLQNELEESTKQIETLQGRSVDGTGARTSAPRQSYNTRREEARRSDPSPAPQTRFYQTVRSTSVFEEPTSSSRQVASIPNGSRVRVVGSSGDWLEVRSKQGRPPGFIRREDAVLMR